MFSGLCGYLKGLNLIGLSFRKDGSYTISIPLLICFVFWSCDILKEQEVLQNTLDSVMHINVRDYDSFRKQLEYH